MPSFLEKLIHTVWILLKLTEEELEKQQTILSIQKIINSFLRAFLKDSLLKVIIEELETTDGKISPDSAKQCIDFGILAIFSPQKKDVLCWKVEDQTSSITVLSTLHKHFSKCFF